MKKTILVLVVSCIYITLTAQTANFIPTEKGVVCTYKYLDAKGKPEIVEKTKEEAFMRQTVVDVEQGAGATIVTISCESNQFNNLEKNAVNEKILEDLKNMKFRIEGNVLYADNILAKTSTLLSSEFEKMASGDMKMDMTADGKQTQLPLNLAVGQTLPDEEVLKVTIKMTGIMDMTFYTITSYKNRKVEAKEDVTTPAGTFHCFKINYDLDVSMDMGMMQQNAVEKVIEWLSPEIGIIKTERYNQKGKLSSTMLLSELQKPVQ